MLVDRGRNSLHIEIHPQGFGISSFEKKNTQVGFNQYLQLNLLLFADTLGTRKKVH